MTREEKIKFYIKEQRIDLAKIVVVKLLQAEHKAEWDKAMIEEYNLLYPKYRSMTENEKVLYLEDLRQEDETIDAQTIEYPKVEIDYSEDETYITFREWLDETYISGTEEYTEEVWNGETQTYDTVTNTRDIRELVRPYITMSDTELQAKIDEYLAPYNYNKWKANRQSKVDNIEVEYNGVIYQGDEISQTRMDRASRSLEKKDLTEPDNAPHTTTWIAKDNSEHKLNSEDLANLVILAGEIQTSIWSTGRPVLEEV